jgi:hypothetical protein
VSLYLLTPWLLEAIVTVQKQPIEVAGERRTINHAHYLDAIFLHASN